ncbi:hypothetical protein [Caulobacter endophyticus]|uniref:hypothetical protein n=1 Tax=Caulobacter endophyticus TaxID=2172652 RepID=UPI00240FAB6D|nr:hypothetical protein [Caulobacter endophyticus]MDG2527909.1 hypothetical protein [Caulobacter endophyticus]
MLLSLIGGPAILTNACATMQNSATIRYSLAIAQWREFRASIVASDDLISRHFADGQAAQHLAARRIRRLLLGLDLLYAAAGLFGASALMGLAGAILAAAPAGMDVPVGLVAGVGGVGVLALLAALTMFVLESRCARRLMALQLRMQVH